MTEPEPQPDALGRVKRLAKTLVATGHNRIELLLLELQEEQHHLIRMLMLGVGTAFLGLLSSIALSAALVVVLWNTSPVLVLLGLAIFYALAAWWAYRKLLQCQANWKSLAETADQLQKDRVWLEKTLT